MRWTTFSKRCAAPRTLPSINPALALAVVFVLGLVLFALGMALPAKQSAYIPWTQRVDDSALNLDDRSRIELIERLGIIGAPWCETILVQARNEESDPLIQRAITSALADCREASRS